MLVAPNNPQGHSSNLTQTHTPELVEQAIAAFARQLLKNQPPLQNKPVRNPADAPVALKAIVIDDALYIYETKRRSPFSPGPQKNTKGRLKKCSLATRFLLSQTEVFKGEKCARLVMNLSPTRHIPEPVAFFKREVQLHKMLADEPLVCKLYGATIYEGSSHETATPKGVMFQKYCEGGDLDHWLQSPIKPSSASNHTIFLGLLAAYAKLHARKVMHIDPSLANHLIDEKGSVVITDLGFALTEEERREVEKFKSYLDKGSILYLSPERFEFIMSEKDDLSRVGLPADVWAIGTLMYRMRKGTFPRSAEILLEIARTPLRRSIAALKADWVIELKRLEDAAAPLRSRDPQTIDELIQRMLDPKPEARITAEAAFNVYQTLSHDVQIDVGCAPGIGH